MFAATYCNYAHAVLLQSANDCYDVPDNFQATVYSLQCVTPWWLMFAGLCNLYKPSNKILYLIICTLFGWVLDICIVCNYNGHLQTSFFACNTPFQEAKMYWDGACLSWNSLGIVLRGYLNSGRFLREVKLYIPIQHDVYVVIFLWPHCLQHITHMYDLGTGWHMHTWILLQY